MPVKSSVKQKDAPRLPLWKKLLFSFLSLAVFFGLIEFILFLVGVKPLSYEEDPYVGFSSQIPLFVEKEGQEATRVTARNKTRFFNKQEFLADKPDQTTRIFCLGGSTTYGRPYDDTTSFSGWLRELLPAADSSQKWEVINAGGISYASYRVAALMEELVEYEPDIFIIYCGQNEFLERRTYSGIIDMPEAVRGLSAILSKTRTYSGISRIIRGSKEKDNAEATELDGEVNAILDQSVGPEDYERDEELTEQVLDHYRFNMARMVDIARAHGTKVLFVTPASNLRNCSPFKSQHRDGLSDEASKKWDAELDEAEKMLGTENFANALEILDQLLNLDDRHAKAHYLRGRALEGLAKHDEAKTSYERALAEDVCPLRALSPMPSIVREVAQDRDVPVVDFASLVEAESPHGIAGAELFLDHVHPTINGHRMMALAMLDEMASRDWLTKKSDWSESNVDTIASKIMKKVDPQKQGVAMRNLSKVYSWAGKMEDAYGAAKKALELYPGDAEAHYQVGNLARQLGKNDEAIERLTYLCSANLSPQISFYLKAHVQLSDLLSAERKYEESEGVIRKLLQMDPQNETGREQIAKLLTNHGRELMKAGDPAGASQRFAELSKMQPNHFELQVQLGVALVRSRDYPNAAKVLQKLIKTRSDYLPAYDDLGFVLAQLGKLDEAEQACLDALKINPDHEAAHKNLRQIRKMKGAQN